MSNKKGFTLIELLVVIAIIGLLATIVLVNVNSTKARSRDAVRYEDLRQIYLAIEMYYSEYQNYPRNAGWCTQISNPTNNWGPDFQADIAPWMPNVSLDPIYAGTYRDYFYRNIDDQSFYLYAELEQENRPSDEFSGCARIGGQPNEYDYRIPSF